MRRQVLFVMIAAFATAVGSCSRVEPPPLDRKVVVLGIDGLEWDIMGPMLESGRLPNFAKLIHEGSWGELKSLEFLESPMIWTSIATGKLPEKHGITGFTTKRGAAREGALLTSNFRTARTIWDILGERGKTVGVLLWLVTWPPEPVNGYLVSDYFHYGWDRPGHFGEQRSYPAELDATLASLLRTADDVPDERAAEFLRGEIPTGGEFDVQVRSLKSAIASDETARSVGLRMAEESPVDFYALYFRGLDAVCHRFWVDTFPESGPPVTDREVELFGEVIPRYYEYADSILGDFLGLIDDETTLIVTSDHGHSGPKPRGDSYAWGIAMHDPTGVLILWGKDIVPGRELSEPSVLDITPTILALYGLPVAKDMDGRVLVDAVDPAFLRSHPLRSVDTYERGGGGESAGGQEPVESSVDEKVKERLRSLGYIE